MRLLHWFRNDLRLDDNPALFKAAAAADELLCVYIFDERWFDKGIHGGSRISGFRAKFIWECLSELKQDLDELGAHLLILRGNPASLIPKVADAFNCDAVSFNKHVGYEEQGDENEVIQKLGERKIISDWGHTLVDINDLPFPPNKLPKVFTEFRKRIEKYHTYPEPLPKINNQFKPIEQECPGILEDYQDLGLPIPKVDERAVLEFKGGESQALRRVKHYLWESRALSTYKETRNGLIGPDYSSKFSPWLASGSISPRCIHREIVQYEEKVEANDSTYWLIFELLWRDFFQLVSIQHGKNLFAEFGWKGIPRTWSQNSKLFEKWKNGETGDPFVDANMIELKKSGFMSNRGRQNVASFLSHQYKVDWRWGASYFEEVLIDYDVASNWGNWSYVSGTGNDPRKDRVFNTKLQAERYDPKGEFQRIWLERLN